MKTQFRIVEVMEFGKKKSTWYIQSREKEWIGWSPWSYLLDTRSNSEDDVNYILRYLIENKIIASWLYGEIHTVTEQKTKGDKVRDMILFLLCCIIMYTFIYVCARL